MNTVMNFCVPYNAENFLSNLGRFSFSELCSMELASISAGIVSEAITSAAVISEAIISVAVFSATFVSEATVSAKIISEAFISAAVTSEAFISAAVTSEAFISAAVISEATISPAVILQKVTYKKTNILQHFSDTEINVCPSDARPSCSSVSDQTQVDYFAVINGSISVTACFYYVLRCIYMHLTCSEIFTVV